MGFFLNLDSRILIKHIKHYLIFLFVFVTITNSYSTHIVGGELYYTHLSGNTYKVTLKLYRDCLNGQPNFGGLGEGEAIINVTNYNNDLMFQFILGTPLVTKVPANTNNACMKAPNGVCVEEGVYTKIITLPPLAGGYFITYETCCRNNSVLNLVSPGGQGSTYKTYVPGPEAAPVNSSPRFNSYPSLYVCKGEPINFNHTAVDPDGDSLVYSLRPAYNGLSTDTLVFYKSPYNGLFPMSSNPALSINSNNGTINGTPTLLGQWVVCIEVKEYRNGKLLNKHYRDFQFNVISCALTVESGMVAQTDKCNGSYTVSFTNQSYSNFGMSYLWNFGVANSGTDTSSAKDPVYTYQDTGKYIVTLVVNPGLPCADSVKKTFYVYPKFAPQFNVPATPQCFKTNTLNFNVGGIYNSNATFTSNFSSGASPNISNAASNTVVFNAPGIYPIKMYAKQYVCSDSLIDSLRIISRPISKINNFPVTLCDPATVAFSNGSYSEYQTNYLWKINNGATYYTYEPTHIFTPAGNYSVTLTLLRSGVCADTAISPVYNLTVFPSPKAEFVFSPTTTTIFDPQINFVSYSSGNITNLHYDFADGYTSDYMNERHTYSAPGTYNVSLTVTNNFDCKDVITKEVVILPEFRFWVPNAFTPSGDGLNDVFKPLAIGIKDYKMEVYDKGGQRLFYSYDTDKGWDGQYKGKPCKQDSYIWKASYINEVSGKYTTETGHVALFNQE